MTWGTERGQRKFSHSLWGMRETKYRQSVKSINSGFWGVSWSHILETSNCSADSFITQTPLWKGNRVSHEKDKTWNYTINYKPSLYGYILHLGESELKGYTTNSLFKWYFYYPLNITQCVITFTLDLEIVNLRH